MNPHHWMNNQSGNSRNTGIPPTQSALFILSIIMLVFEILYELAQELGNDEFIEQIKHALIGK